MKIKVWGCRGSLPAPGEETVRYGGDSTCIEIRNNNDELIIIDAGSGIRKLGMSLLEEKELSEFTLLFTHAHWDHLMGFPFFRPAYFSKYKINLCGGPVPNQILLEYLKHQMESPFFPVNFDQLNAEFVAGCRCEKGNCGNVLTGVQSSFRCSSIPLNHPDGGYGFKFTEDEKSFVFLSDNEIRFNHEGGRTRGEYVGFCKDADLLIHDAQYREAEYEKTRGWGHSTFQDAIDLAIDAGVKRLGLFHHDPDRTDRYLDRQFDRCIDYIEKKQSPLECFFCKDGMKLHL